MYGNRTWYLFEDPELRLVHSSRQCPEARVAAKYNYLVSVSVTEGRGGLIGGEWTERARPCPRCVKEATRRPGLAPPGFRVQGVLMTERATRPRGKRRPVRREARP